MKTPIFLALFTVFALSACDNAGDNPNRPAEQEGFGISSRASGSGPGGAETPAQDPAAAGTAERSRKEGDK